MEQHLGAYTFSSDMSRMFALLSGDSNPIHLDNEAARRTYFGKTIVHGIHLVLRGCELFCSADRSGVEPRQLKVFFNKPVSTGSTIDYFVSNEPAKKLIKLNGICNGSLVFRAVIYMQNVPITSLKNYHEDYAPFSIQPVSLNDEPLDLDQSQLVGLQGELRLDFSAEKKESQNLFPQLMNCWPPSFLNGMLTSTYIVGMRAPGLHSIFTSLDISWEYATNNNGPEFIRFHVVDMHPTIRRCEVKAVGASWRATMQAFIRPKPSIQPKYQELAARVKSGLFTGQRALVLGGSRGIGECTAKLLAAGGADVVLSYAVSKKIASSVVEEITAGGGNGRMIEFNTDEGISITDALPGSWHPTHLYYFITPPIIGERFEFSHYNFEHYFHHYVTLFNQIVTQLREVSKYPLSILWPSSAAVSEIPQGMVEYAMAKSAGEVLCKALMTQQPKIEIYTPRLPRIRTDLTANPLVAEGLDAADVMLPILTKMMAFLKIKNENWN